MFSKLSHVYSNFRSNTCTHNEYCRGTSAFSKKDLKSKTFFQNFLLVGKRRHLKIFRTFWRSPFRMSASYKRQILSANDLFKSHAERYRLLEVKSRSMGSSLLRPGLNVGLPKIEVTGLSCRKKTF
jgi:hypothetical protein